MKRRFASFTIVVFAAFQVLAQDTHRIAVDDFSFRLDESVATQVNIVRVPGDPVDFALGRPQLPHTALLLYTEERTPQNSYMPPGDVSIYRMADIAGYPIGQEQVDQLQALLAERPALYTVGGSLPYLPINSFPQMIRGDARYVDLETMTGISYLVSYQDLGPYERESFQYTFQGISKGGTSYVSAVFRVKAQFLPEVAQLLEDAAAFQAIYDQYLDELQVAVDYATPNDFLPTLFTLDAIIETFAFDALTAPIPDPSVMEDEPKEIN
jgi:hypothetical protein